MRYVSTRGGGEPQRFSDILLEGLALDGGLYVPEEYPQVSSGELSAMRSMAYPELTFALLSKFMDDIPAGDLRRMVNGTYTKEVFGTDEIVPVKKLEQGLYLLGLSEGPTLAFKDIALQLLGRLFEHTLAQRNEPLNILGATSGDTGSAAEYALRGRKGIRVFMLSPIGRMSEFQRRQMYTLSDPNIFNIAIRGTFDDCQDIVKALNEDAAFKKRYKLGAVNSINWARIAAQIVYYFWACVRVARENGEPDFAVPTGNFGNILAGYIAKRMGLPIRRLILATNENNALEEFFKTGVYRPRKGSEVAATSSPSMDISKASNFERYVFDLVGRDVGRMAKLWSDLKENGYFDVSKAGEFARLAEDGFVAGSSTHADRLATIRAFHEKYGVLIDPHTADGVKVGLEHREKGVPLVCLETARPAKFAATIREAVGQEPPMPESFRKLANMPEHFEVLPPDNEAVGAYIARRIA
ncbi:threonine synthase [Candidatus Kaiserbacteria bacterium RIFCSPHIGHO2_02_FULL_59_21]|uniref:Threonine synthase n=2 Tax=Candidatus Kaiseribacteriota TaxID=1752734 RepID=A0A0G2AWS7_9BACT|nr:MAG: Threonine synthase [Candidatus Kaiserbacteria bacterium GW2011_GWA2_58_9]OGG63003.1 MAG: threonine synthase [Candidatus Kaiserbacteria bacterium RIFCSPHIGHO2_01_FULL_58_22]OGG66659.1 MAG: threonine synthase [Candidatus Kaiserbacteria bacterium RIFCSPHIGHO2_02_FULL_59_21]OGG78966.1 MAG: threonine synthase [Candidatus Kaiserbacteria bacterium RIFCSPLOWO2_01_FULL_59_34]OGG84410.1 MAG: threonine synthase [Candidatus Kaiserbacteria bacterium RIFCSPLOWO2_02_FULL_59_19]